MAAGGRDGAMPIQICWGADDAVAPVAIAHRLKDRVKPSAKLTIVDGLGHFAPDPGIPKPGSAGFLPSGPKSPERPGSSLLLLPVPVEPRPHSFEGAGPPIGVQRFVIDLPR